MVFEVQWRNTELAQTASESGEAKPIYGCHDGDAMPARASWPRVDPARVVCPLGKA
jgi:hypothetical protein